VYLVIYQFYQCSNLNPLIILLIDNKNGLEKNSWQSRSFISRMTFGYIFEFLFPVTV